MCCSAAQTRHDPGQCHGHRGMAGVHNGRGCHGHSLRRVYSRQEELARLEDYLRELQAEVKAVEERINGFKAGK